MGKDGNKRRASGIQPKGNAKEKKTMQQVKGYKPDQMPKINQHREEGLRIKAGGISAWRKAEIVAGIMIGTGCGMIAFCMLFSMILGAN